jgi:hypothetical protein
MAMPNPLMTSSRNPPPFETAHKKGRLDRPLVIEESAEIHIRSIRLWMCREKFSDGARGK